MVPLGLYKKVAKDLTIVYEAAADKGLEKPRNRCGISDYIEHFVDIEVLQHFLVVKYPEVKGSVINVAEGEGVSVFILINDIALNLLSVNNHAFNGLNFFHRLEIIVLNMIDLICLLAENDRPVHIVYNGNGHNQETLSVNRQSHRQRVEDSPIGLKMVVDFLGTHGLDGRTSPIDSMALVLVLDFKLQLV